MCVCVLVHPSHTVNSRKSLSKRLNAESLNKRRGNPRRRRLQCLSLFFSHLFVSFKEIVSGYLFLFSFKVLLGGRGCRAGRPVVQSGQCIRGGSLNGAIKTRRRPAAATRRSAEGRMFVAGWRGSSRPGGEVWATRDCCRLWVLESCASCR